MNKKIVFLPYDMDTAIGINNEGALVLDYNLEDTDTLDGAEVFNGQSSVLWNNLRECFPDELKAMYQQLRSSGALSYARVEEAFEEHQSVWPEAVFNEDAFFKYIQPLMDDGDESYLSMLQGSKEEQRKWWLNNRFKYIDSKYNAGDSLTDRIQLRGYNKANIVVTPYADIYASIKWGSYLDNQRAPRNIAKTMVCPMDNLNDTEIYIYSASQLASIGDLSGLKVGFADFHNAVKLQELILGSTESGYSNSNLRSVNVGNLKLLRKIDVRNCVGLGTFSDQKTVDLSGCSGIEEVYFDGTSILGVELPNGGFLKKLHLPGTITNLTVKNQKNLTEFVCPDFSNVSTLVLENNSSAINIGDIVDDVASGCRIRLYNYRLDFNSVADVHDFLDKFEGMTGIDQNGNNLADPQIAITVHVPSADGDDIDGIIARYPDITVDADSATYYVRYYDWEGETLLYTETVAKGNNGAYSGTPNHSSTAQYTFAFAGWNTRRRSTIDDPDCRNNVNGNINVYAAYTTVIRTYTVTFKNNDNTVLQTVQNVPYGGDATYTGETPIHSSNPEFMVFKEWSPSGINITGDTNCIAQYEDTSIPLVKYFAGTLTKYESDSVGKIGQYAFYSYSGLTEAEITASVIDKYAFAECPSLEVVDITVPENEVLTIYMHAFDNCWNLKAIVIRSDSVAEFGSGSAAGYIPQWNFAIAEHAGLYVKSELIPYYKAIPAWTQYVKNKIFPLEEYPKTDFSTINMTWAQIKAAIDDESFFSSGYSVGDTKSFICIPHDNNFNPKDESYKLYAEIRKIDSTNKYVDFIVRNSCQLSSWRLSGSQMTYFADSRFLTTLNWLYNNGIPLELKNIITPVTKKYHAYDDTIETLTLPLWMLNTKDAGLTGNYLLDNDGGEYFSDNSSRIKAQLRQVSDPSHSLGDYWALGSAKSSTKGVFINSSGIAAENGPGSNFPIVFGFRIQKV